VSGDGDQANNFLVDQPLRTNCLEPSTGPALEQFRVLAVKNRRFLTSAHTRESILCWILTTFHRRRRELSELRSTGTFHHLT
jgi:hypothetical protein